MAIPVTKTEPPKPGMVRLKRVFGTVAYDPGRRMDVAELSAQTSNDFFSIEAYESSDGDGPFGDFDADRIADALQQLANKIKASK